MGQHEEKIEIMRKYADRISNYKELYVKGNIPSKKLIMQLVNLQMD